jgi:molybdate transport system regulatory protein
MRAEVTFAGENAAPLGRQRIALLEAIGREGSIAGAARSSGISYKTAWDAVGAMNNLFGSPLVASQTGGRRGGGAALTEDGRRLVEAFHRLEAEMGGALARIELDLWGTGLSASDVLWGMFMRTSARNALRGTVSAVIDGAVNAEVHLSVAGETTIIAIITRDSLRDLGLFPGRPATALIKAPFVVLAPEGEALRTSMRNRIEGTIARIEPGAVNAEVTLDIGGDKSLTAIVTLRSVEDLGLKVGARACALIDASHVILAVS